MFFIKVSLNVVDFERKVVVLIKVRVVLYVFWERWVVFIVD